MQTFLPYADFTKVARCLDDNTLAQQRHDVLIILRTLDGKLPGWTQHPAVTMWYGFTEALVKYGVAICDEYRRRGNTDTCRPIIQQYSWGEEVVQPPWINRKDLHRSHRSNLIQLNCVHYSKWNNVPKNLPYIWPSKEY